MGPKGEDRPKALIEIGGRPLVWHIMKLHAYYGHTQFVFPLGHRGEDFRRYFLSYQALAHDLTFTLGEPHQRVSHGPNDEAAWRLTMFDAGLHTDKGARVRRAAAQVEGERFLATYGDGIGDVDLAALLRFHRAHGRLATLTAYQPYSQYGILELSADVVTGLREKPRLATWINAGFFCFERGAVAYMQGRGADDATVDLERDTLATLAADGQLMAYRHTGFWASMDTFKEAEVLNETWEQSAPWKVWA